MPIVKCGCKECKFYDDRFYCTKDVIELKAYGQCAEGIKVELNKAKVELNKAIEEQRAAAVPYYNYNTYLGGRRI